MRIALKTHQTTATHFYILNCHSKISLRNICLKVPVEYTCELGEILPTRCLAPGFGITKSLQMDILDSRVTERRRQSFFGKTLTARNGQFTNVY